MISKKYISPVNVFQFLQKRRVVSNLANRIITYYTCKILMEFQCTTHIPQKFSVLSIQIIILYFHKLSCDGETEIVRLRYKNYHFTR